MRPEGFLAVARHVPEPLLLVAPGGEVLAANEAAGALFGVEPAALRGRSFLALGPPGAAGAAEVLRRFGRSTEPLPAALPLRLADGEVHDCWLRGARVAASPEQPLLVRLGRRDGAESNFALLTRRVEELTREVLLRRRVEDERARALTREREARTAAEEAQAELRQALSARDTLIWVASHELKTPLNALTLQIDAMLRFAPGLATEPRTLRRLQGARQQLTLLTRLIEELLDVSRLTAGRLTLQPEPLDLVELLGGLLDRESEVLARAGCALDLVLPDGRVDGEWDRLRLEQAVLNLLSNAVKFGAGRPVRVALEADPARVRITVADRGIGIAPEDQARIFERFERAVSNEHFGGLGLGLWIVREVVAASGGEVRCESAPGDGARFTLDLPRRPAPPALTGGDGLGPDQLEELAPGPQ